MNVTTDDRVMFYDFIKYKYYITCFIQYQVERIIIIILINLFPKIKNNLNRIL